MKTSTFFVPIMFLLLSICTCTVNAQNRLQLGWEGGAKISVKYFVLYSSNEILGGDPDNPIAETVLVDGARYNNSFEEGLFGIVFGFEAVTSGNPASVRLELQGPNTFVAILNEAPFTFDPDLNFTPGFYTLKATPYIKDNLCGSAGSTKSISFEIFNGCEEAESNTMIQTAGTNCSLASGSVLFTTPSGFYGTFELRGLNVDAAVTEESGVTNILFEDLLPGDYTAFFGSGDSECEFSFFEFMIGESEECPEKDLNLKSSIDRKDMTISPNQAVTYAEVSFGEATNIDRILIFDMSGRLLHTHAPDNFKRRNSYVMDVSLYEPGIYIVKIIDDKGLSYQKQMAVN